ncbi:bifunctional (p)ppGpp synthetase/guanosine-3',5'-bis(diphosphate) 3'-pyrophosphohydrolase [bacterium]|nr:MAG: bifunctional (p)ppGpp synthetase/guanosine-3',5'-bis(diphosphate) 3'-pyrophosphohydrolase [bacterium]
MNHTPQIKRAIQFAARKHHGQMRLEKEPLPYITHLFSVALLVAESGASDDVVTAALLHDTIEDTDTAREEIVEAFNEHVAELVESVSEIKQKDDKRLEWKEIKEHYLTHLEDSSDDAVLISVADKIDNIESMLEAYEKEGESFLRHWEHPYEEHVWFHGEVLRIALKRIPNHSLTKRLAEVHAKQLELFS